MKINLIISGQEKNFSESELVQIVEEYFKNQNQNKKEEDLHLKKQKLKGYWFEVNPTAIDQQLFAVERKKSGQEYIRQLILEAFEELKKRPEKYARPFRITEAPNSYRETKLLDKMFLANNIGDHMADWVELALVWAQKIANGKSWESICESPDEDCRARIFIWKNGCARLVGGHTESIHGTTKYSQSDIHNYNLSGTAELREAPLVVLYN